MVTDDLASRSTAAITLFRTSYLTLEYDLSDSSKLNQFSDSSYFF